MSTKVILSKTDAVSLLPDKHRVHTFRQAGPILMGCDVDKSAILEDLEKHDAELSGPGAAAMHHGLVITDDTGPLFIETDDDALARHEQAIAAAPAKVNAPDEPAQAQ